MRKYLATFAMLVSAEVKPLKMGGIPAGLVIIASERKHRIGDLLAGTLVVSTATQSDDDSVQPGYEPAPYPLQTNENQVL